MNRHDLANLEQLALLRESLKAEPTQLNDVTETARPASKPATPGSPPADPKPLSPGRLGLMGN